MAKIKAVFGSIYKETTGATSIEYAIVASIVSIAAIGAFLGLGDQSNAQLSSVETAYANVNTR